LGNLGKLAASKLTNYDKASQWKPELGSLYDLKVTDIDGNPYDLAQLKGKVSLVCNVASECGYTKCGYQFLQEEQNKYSSRGFTVLGFPCNQFMGQEPGEAKDIKDFAIQHFKVTFPLFSKADVNGTNTQPVFTYLKSVYPGDVPWNFHGMWLINEDGIPIHRYQHQRYPEIDTSIKQALDDRDQRLKEHNGTETAAVVEQEDKRNSSQPGKTMRNGRTVHTQCAGEQRLGNLARCYETAAGWAGSLIRWSTVRHGHASTTSRRTVTLADATTAEGAGTALQ